VSDKKKGFQPPPSGTSAGAPTGSTPPSSSTSSSSRAAARRSGQSAVRVSPEPTNPIEKYRFPIIIGVLIVGILAIGAIIASSANAAPYTCTTQMTPGPIETDPVGAVVPATSAAPAGSVAPGSSSAPATAAPAATPWLGFVAQDMGQGHVSESTSVTYAYCPPTSGQHFSSSNAPLPRRFYGPTDTVRPGNWVHNLEHGYVVLLYQGEPDAATLAELRRIMEETPGTQYTTETCGAINKVIAARFDDMTTPYAAVSWDRAMLLEEFDPEKLQTFAEQWQESPVWPEKGVC
jgi:hypothetical protein